MPEKTEAQKRAQKTYMDKFARIELRLTMDQRDQIKEHAAADGISVNAWIGQAIEEKMQKEDSEG